MNAWFARPITQPATGNNQLFCQVAMRNKKNKTRTHTQNQAKLKSSTQLHITVDSL